MKKLLKIYSFISDMQYYEMIVDSVINGQIAQAKDQFKAMPKISKKEFVKAIYGNWCTSLSQRDKEMFLNLL